MNVNMTRIEKEAIRYLAEHEFSSQRYVANEIGCSLGMINQILKNLKMKKLIDNNNHLTKEARELVEQNSPRRAVILAAGAGMRMVPINVEISKGLLEVKRQALIERTICQLQEKGVMDITIVVGFMKEQYEYLMDQYQVNLIVNARYAKENNLYSLYLAREYLENAYIVPCDIWCEKNLFRTKEMDSWYLVQEEKTRESNTCLTSKGQLVLAKSQEVGNKLIGIAYLNAKTGELVKQRLEEMVEDETYENSFWEETLWEGKRFLVPGRVDGEKSAFEINSYEDLRQLDPTARHLKSDVVELIAEVLQTYPEKINNIRVLKKGMTNRSFRFSCLNKQYIMRIPGEGTDLLMNRQQEYDVYSAIKNENLCDKVCYLNSDNGYKITEYLDGVRTCNPYNKEDVAQCMRFLREFHRRNLQVSHTFDLFGKIEYYEQLWEGEASCYRDYMQTKKHVFKLKKYIDSMEKETTLTHIDAVPDNFLIQGDKIYLIDWEYAGMQDPHLDVAMFAAYAMYQREHVDQLIDAYFEEACPKPVRLKIYCYLAAAGLLWSNWCEYKGKLGVEFGEYSLRQYRFAKDYYKIVQEELGNGMMDDCENM